MKIRYLIIFIIIYIAVGAVICKEIAGSDTDNLMKNYSTEINRLLIDTAKNWDELSGLDSEKIKSAEEFDYSVIDAEGRLLVYTLPGIATSVSAASRDYDIIRDIEKDGSVVGKLIVHNASTKEISRRNKHLALSVAIGLMIMLMISVLFYIYLQRRIIKPFGRLKGFAEEVAAGDLDHPLEMDRNHVFGSFTEGFDIMREELKASRLREEAAVKSRKELVAELSHDIKTPVSSIKAMVDVMMLTTEDEAEKETLQSINAKADQIDKLISNLFHATLEELEQLEVKPEELSSDRIRKMIAEADFRKLTTTCDIKDAAVLADSLRLEQVINNIYSNSYKYAGTPITVTSRFEEQEIEFSDDTDFDEQDDKTDINSGTENDKLTDVVFKNTCNYLVIDFSDEGGGVPEEELEIIMEKFRRGSNSAGKSGSGIGLYISRYLMDKMEGGLDCSNNPKGFTVTVRLKLI